MVSVKFFPRTAPRMLLKKGQRETISLRKRVTWSERDIVQTFVVGIPNWESLAVACKGDLFPSFILDVSIKFLAKDS